MSTLAPKLESGVAFEQPVSTPGTDSSLAEGVAGLSRLFVNTSAPRAASATNQLAQDKQRYYTELKRGTAAKEQGRKVAGERIIRQAYANFSTKYGREHEDVNTSFTDATGISFDTEVTNNPVEIEQFVGTPEFNIQAGLIQQNNPDATPEQVFNIALEREMERQANDLRIKNHEQEEKLNWIDVEQDYVDKARIAGETVRGMLALAQNDDIITIEEAKELRNFYDQFYGGITKPVGIPQEDWDNYKENYLDTLTHTVDGIIGLGQNGGITKDRNRALDHIINKAISQDKLSPMLIAKMEGVGANNYDALIELLDSLSKDDQLYQNYNWLMNASYTDMLNWVTEFENKTDLTELQVNTEEFLKRNPQLQRNSIVQDLALKHRPDSNVPAAQKSIDLYNVNRKLEAIDAPLQPRDFQNVFNPTYFSNLQKVYEANPIIGEQLALDAVNQIASQKAAITLALQSEARQAGYKIIDGQLIVDLDSVPADMKAVVDKFFGGDWKLAVENRGVDANGRTHSEIAIKVKAIEKKLAPRVATLTAATRITDQLTETFLSDIVEGGEGSDNLEGGAGNGPIADKLGINFDNLERTHGLPVGFLERTAHIESKGDPKAKNSRSSAGGLFQQIDSNARAYGVENKFDPVQSTMGAIEFAKDNQAILERRLGRPVTGAELYLAHQQGAGGAARLLANPGVRAVDVVGEDAVKLNGGDSNMTAGEFANIWISKFNGERGPISMAEAIGSQDVPPAASLRPPPDPVNLTVEGTQVASQSDSKAGVTGETSTSGGTLPETSETPPQSKEQSEQVWVQLSQETKSILIRLFGNEEAVIEALSSGEVTEEDLKGVSS